MGHLGVLLEISEFNLESWGELGAILKPLGAILGRFGSHQEATVDTGRTAVGANWEGGGCPKSFQLELTAKSEICRYKD